MDESHVEDGSKRRLSSDGEEVKGNTGEMATIATDDSFLPGNARVYQDRSSGDGSDREANKRVDEQADAAEAIRRRSLDAVDHGISTDHDAVEVSSRIDRGAPATASKVTEAAMAKAAGSEQADCINCDDEESDEHGDSLSESPSSDCRSASIRDSVAPLDQEDNKRLPLKHEGDGRVSTAVAAAAASASRGGAAKIIENAASTRFPGDAAHALHGSADTSRSTAVAKAASCAGDIEDEKAHYKPPAHCPGGSGVGAHAISSSATSEEGTDGHNDASMAKGPGAALETATAVGGAAARMPPRNNGNDHDIDHDKDSSLAGQVDARRADDAEEGADDLPRPGAFAVSRYRSPLMTSGEDDDAGLPTLPGAYAVNIPVTAGVSRPPMHAETDAGGNSGGGDDETDNSQELHHTVLDAHVAPSDEEAAARNLEHQEERQRSLHEHIRERLIRNAPLVEAKAVDPDNEEGSGEVSVGIVAAPARQNEDRRDLANGHANAVVEGNPSDQRRGHLCFKDPRGWCLRHWKLTSLLLLAAATALALGIAIPLSTRSTNESENINDGAPPSPLPTSGPPPGWNATLEPSLAPTSAPTSLPSSSAVWKAMGSPIAGLRNESGLTMHINFATGARTFGHGPKSNATLSGVSVALSDDGRTLALGEAGTDTVRVFRWDAGANDWVQKGQTLKAELDCEHVHNVTGSNGRRNIRQRRTHLLKDDPTQFLPCYMLFGYKVQISGDGLIVSASAIGYLHQVGLVRVFKWDDEKVDWVQLGSDLVGDERNQVFGGTHSLSNNGTTLAVVSPQTIMADAAFLFGVQVWNDGPGFVQVFDWNGTSWAQRGDTLVGYNDEESLGTVDLSEDGQSVAIGTILGGYVEVYDWDQSLLGWELRGEMIVAPIGEANFGTPVLFAAEDANRLVIGSNYAGDGETEGACLVYVYGWDGFKWVQLDRMNIFCIGLSNAPMRQHHDVIVTDDGNVLAAVFTAGAQIYEWNGLKYVPKGGPVEGGIKVSLSNNGKVFAVGRPNDSALGLGLGRTSVHQAA